MHVIVSPYLSYLLTRYDWVPDSHFLPAHVQTLRVEAGGDAEELSAVAGAILALRRCLQSFEAIPSDPGALEGDPHPDSAGFDQV